MKDDIIEAKKKDLILEFLLKKPEQYFSPHVIQKDLFIDLNLVEVKRLVKVIIDSVNNIVVGNSELYDDMSIKANSNTEEFLIQGGFTKIEEELLEKYKKGIAKEKLEIDLAESTIKTNNNITKFARFNSWIMIINIFLCIINLLLISFQLFF